MSAATTDPKVLAALRSVHLLDGRATVRSVAAAANKSVRTTHESLNRLQTLGLVEWESDRSGTLRPAYPAPPPAPPLPRPPSWAGVQALCRAWDAQVNGVRS
jgi:hypothetical protein